MRDSISILIAISVAGVLGVSALAGPSPKAPIVDPGVSAEDATLFPVPDYTGDLLERGYLMGDWGGTRTAIADQGVQVELAMTETIQTIWEGGRAIGTESLGSADYIFKFDFQKMGLWQGAFLQVNVESIYGQNVNQQTGVLMPVLNDALYPVPNRQLTAVPSIVFTQFLSERFGIILGKLDTTAGDRNEFAWSKGDEGFLNLAFGLNPVPALTTPYSTLGAGAFFLLNDDSIITFSVYDPDGSATRTGFDSFFENGTAFSLETRIGTRFLDKPGHQLVGGTYSNRDYIGVSQDARLVIGNILSGRRPLFQRQSDSWSVYYNFDQYLVGGEDGRGFGIFGRVGFADDTTNVVEEFYSFGVGGKGMFPSRENDSFGAGYYYLGYSDKLPGRLPRDDHEQGFEVFYSIAVTPWLSITPDIQVVNSPLRGVDNAVVGAVRGKIRF